MQVSDADLEQAMVQALGALGCRAFVKFDRVLDWALQFLGLEDPVMESWLADEEADLVGAAESFYDAAATIVRAGNLIEGQGNFGGCTDQSCAVIDRRRSRPGGPASL